MFRLNMECLLDCDCGSVDVRASLEIGGGEGVDKSFAREEGDSSLEFVGTDLGLPGEGVSSGFAILRPPKVWLRLKSFSMAFEILYGQILLSPYYWKWILGFGYLISQP
jgi:hypothetical protein